MFALLLPLALWFSYILCCFWHRIMRHVPQVNLFIVLIAIESLIKMANTLSLLHICLADIRFIFSFKSNVLQPRMGRKPLKDPVLVRCSNLLQIFEIGYTICNVKPCINLNTACVTIFIEQFSYRQRRRYDV